MSKRKRKITLLPLGKKGRILGKFRYELHDKGLYILHFRKFFKTIKVHSKHSWEDITTFVRKYPYTPIPLVHLAYENDTYYLRFPYGLNIGDKENDKCKKDIITIIIDIDEPLRDTMERKRFPKIPIAPLRYFYNLIKRIKIFLKPKNQERASRFVRGSKRSDN